MEVAEASDSPSLPGSASPPIPWGALLVVLPVPFAVMVGLIDFAPLLPLVKGEFALSNTWAGLLVASTILTHTLMQLPGGHLADRMGVKRSVELGLLLMAASIIAGGLAPSLALLLLFRFILGIGTSVVFIAALSSVNMLVPVEKRVVAQSLFGASANIGVLLVMLLSERLARWEGWRGTFVLEGVLILGIAALYAIGFHPEAGVSRIAQASWGETLRERALYLLGLAHILSYGVFTALSAWMATFLWEQHGIGLEWAGPLAAVLPASAVAARVLGGLLSVGRERQVIVLSSFVTAAGLAVMPLLPGPRSEVLDLLLLGWSTSVPFGAIFSYISVVSRKGASGFGFSLVNFVGNVGALAFPPAMGFALDATGSFSLAFGSLAAVAVAGGAVVALGLPRLARVSTV